MKQELSSWILQQLSIEVAFTFATPDVALLNERTSRLHAWSQN